MTRLVVEAGEATLRFGCDRLDSVIRCDNSNCLNI